MKQNRAFTLSHLWFPLLVLAISLASTFFLWRLIERGRIERAEQLFERQTEEITSQMIKRLHDHEQVLLGGNALFHVMGDAVTRRDWRRYVSALNLGENHPGILGFGYALWLTPDQREAHIQEIREEGFPEYDIYPEGERPVYTSIIWLEPFNWRNRRAFGYDMYSEPVRRAAMAKARDTGETTVAAKVLLVQETEKDPQNGMLMYVPSYRQGMPTETVEQRREALHGFVYSPIRMTDFVRGTLSRLPTDIDFEIFAGDVRSEETFMFSSRLADRRSLPEWYRPAFSGIRRVEAYGVDWQFTFSTRPAFDRELDRGKSLATLFIGILASVLLSALAFLQARSRRQALTIAEQMSQQLAAQQKLALHIEQTPLAAIEWDEHFRVTAWNRSAEKIFGFPPEEAIGAHASFILSEAEPQSAEALLGAKSATRQNVTKSGKIIHCDWYNTRLVNKRGDVIGVASLAQDITGRLQAEAQIHETMERLRLATEEAEKARGEAERANRAKSEFLANMSHEIRTPMAIFMPAIEHLMEIDTDPDHRALLKMAEQSAERLRALIEGILDLSRIEAGGVMIEEKVYNLRDSVQAAVELFSLSAQEKNLRLEMDVAPDTPEQVIGDSDKLGQILINLIGNALKFTHKGGIHISVRPRRGQLEFSVSDTGIGIPKEKQHLLFRNFSQTDSSFHRQYGGSGLGLAISKGLVELMGGTIRVQSEEGKGSIFTFTIPLKSASAQALSTPAEPRAELPRETPLARILIADDEPMVLEMVQAIMARGGWQSETAETGKIAFEKWERGAFDLILMDLQMPEMNGIDATLAIRKEEAQRGRAPICIIGMTAHARPEIKAECMAAGMNNVLIKPVQIKEIFSAIDRCISQADG